MKRISFAKIAFFVLIIGTGSLLMNTAPGKSPSAVAEGEKVHWTMEASCAACHGKETESLEKETMAATHSFLTCASCHMDTEYLSTMHDETKRNPIKVKKLRYTEVSDDTCIACHGDYAKLAEATADVTVLTDKNGLIVNPHAFDMEIHAKDIRCIDCHTVHNETPILESAPSVCLDCHHEGVYECNTCHGVG